MKFIKIENVVFPVDNRNDREAAEVALGLLDEKPAQVLFVDSPRELGKAEPKKLNFFINPDRAAQRFVGMPQVY